MGTDEMLMRGGVYGGAKDPQVEEKPKTRVACKIAGGLLIRKSSLGYDDGTGDGVKMMAGQEGHGIRLNGPSLGINSGGVNSHDPFAKDAPFGITEIDSDWNFAKWLEQHQTDPMVRDGLIYEIKDDNQEIAPEYRRLDPNAPA